MSRKFDTTRTHRITILLKVIFCAILVTLLGLIGESQAQDVAAGYEEANKAFMQLALEDRVRLQILLTAAGYWPAVPNADFSVRLFNAIGRFEVDNGSTPSGVLRPDEQQKLMKSGGAFLDRWGFRAVRHPATGTSIWVPVGIPLSTEATVTGFKFTNPNYGVALTYDYFPQFSLRTSFESLIYSLQRKRAQILYSKLYHDEFFAISFSDGITDGYARYHRTGQDGIGFTLSWNHSATDLHVERIATLVSGSLWSSMSGAPFIDPFSVMPPANIARAPSQSPEPQPSPNSEPKEAEPHLPKSGTGVFITTEGHVLTNAHVVRDCLEIRVGLGQGNFASGQLIAKDPANDLALLKVDAKPQYAGALRSDVRLGENVEAFGYPLANVLATSGNFTTGNITALAGLGDDSRFLQISAPVQPGNSGGCDRECSKSLSVCTNAATWTSKRSKVVVLSPTDSAFATAPTPCRTEYFKNDGGRRTV
jgi:serine protease Do